MLVLFRILGVFEYLCPWNSYQIYFSILNCKVQPLLFNILGVTTKSSGFEHNHFRLILVQLKSLDKEIGELTTEIEVRKSLALKLEIIFACFHKRRKNMRRTLERWGSVVYINSSSGPSGATGVSCVSNSFIVLRVHFIVHPCSLLWQILEEDVEKINSDCIKQEEDAFRASIEVSLREPLRKFSILQLFYLMLTSGKCLDN